MTHPPKEVWDQYVQPLIDKGMTIGGADFEVVDGQPILNITGLMPKYAEHIVLNFDLAELEKDPNGFAEKMFDFMDKQAVPCEHWKHCTYCQQRHRPV